MYIITSIALAGALHSGCMVSQRCVPYALINLIVSLKASFDDLRWVNNTCRLISLFHCGLSWGTMTKFALFLWKICAKTLKLLITIWHIWSVTHTLSAHNWSSLLLQHPQQRKPPRGVHKAEIRVGNLVAISLDSKNQPVSLAAHFSTLHCWYHVFPILFCVPLGSSQFSALLTFFHSNFCSKLERATQPVAVLKYKPTSIRYRLSLPFNGYVFDNGYIWLMTHIQLLFLTNLLWGLSRTRDLSVCPWEQTTLPWGHYVGAPPAWTCDCGLLRFYLKRLNKTWISSSRILTWSKLY